MPEQQTVDDIFLFIRKGFEELRAFASSVEDEEIETRLCRIKETAESVGSKPKKRPPPMEIYLNQWNDYVSGRSKELTPGAVRYLCWEPQVATTEKFIHCVQTSETSLSPRALQGIVHSCHQRWEDRFAKGPVVKAVRKKISEYEGLSQTIGKWKENLGLILHPDAPDSLSARFIRSQKPLVEFIQEWHLDEQSPFAQEMVRCATEWCREHLDALPKSQYEGAKDLLFSQLLPWRGWDIPAFKDQVSKLILDRRFERIQGSLIPFVLNNREMGDPRLRWNRPKWLNYEAAKRRLIGMLCKEDIAFFFDHVIPSSEDRQRRKQFWLDYVDHCTSSRPLLGRTDRIRLKPVLQQYNLSLGRFGELRSSQNSAFLLQFDNIVVVDFSRIGACFIYDCRDFEKVIPDFWDRDYFTESVLKQDNHIARIIHISTRHSDWRSDARHVLAAQGIRP